MFTPFFMKKRLNSEDDGSSEYGRLPPGVKVETLSSREQTLCFALYLAKRQSGERYADFMRQFESAFFFNLFVPGRGTGTEPSKTT